MASRGRPFSPKRDRDAAGKPSHMLTWSFLGSTFPQVARCSPVDHRAGTVSRTAIQLVHVLLRPCTCWQSQQQEILSHYGVVLTQEKHELLYGCCAIPVFNWVYPRLGDMKEHTPRVEPPTRRSRRWVSREPLSSTSTWMADVCACSRDPRWPIPPPPCPARNSIALPSRGPRPIFSLTTLPVLLSDQAPLPEGWNTFSALDWPLHLDMLEKLFVPVFTLILSDVQGKYVGAMQH